MKASLPTAIRYILIYAVLLICLIIALGVSLAFFLKHSTDKLGLPVIESSVVKQLDALVSQTPNLNGLVIGRKWKDSMVGDSPPFKGQIEYQASQNGLSVDLLVYWEGDSNKCQIIKIESNSTYSEPKTLWEKH